MLSREKRLVRGRDFDRVYQRGTKVGSKSFSFSFLPNRISVARVGIVVSKKFSKKATERNRAKRIFRGALAAEYGQIRPGYDIVIFVKNVNGLEPKQDAIQRELMDVVKKAGIMK